MLHTMPMAAPYPHAVGFAVADVTPGVLRLPQITVRKALERTVQSAICTCSEAEEKVVEGGDFHSLIAAAALAHKQHYPLVLSPDMIWLTVLQWKQEQTKETKFRAFFLRYLRFLLFDHPL